MIEYTSEIILRNAGGLTPFVKVKMHVRTGYADPSFLRIIFKNAAELTACGHIKLRLVTVVS